MEVIERKRQKVIFEPAKRCSGYDSECVDIFDHFYCWFGNEIKEINGTFYQTKPADGYCPFVIGMINKQ